MTSSPTQHRRLTVLVTCFNRRDLTIRALEALDAAVDGVVDFDVCLVDDGSTDGTSDAIRERFTNVTIIRGDGNLFWNGGMRLAWLAAAKSSPDFYLWLNDDTELRVGAIRDLVAVYDQSSDSRTIVVGCTVDPDSGAVTYGGYKRPAGSLSSLRFVLLNLDETECDTMNGNCVLFPRRSVQDVGVNSEHYAHAYGDIDYGLRARRAGYRITQLPSPVAQQAKNEKYSKSISTLTLRNWRWVLFHPKGVSMKEWLHFCRQHGGWLWPVNFLARYAKMAVNGLR